MTVFILLIILCTAVIVLSLLFFIGVPKTRIPMSVADRFLFLPKWRRITMIAVAGAALVGMILTLILSAVFDNNPSPAQQADTTIQDTTEAPETEPTVSYNESCTADTLKATLKTISEASAKAQAEHTESPYLAPYSLTVTGLSSDVVLFMESGTLPESISVFGTVRSVPNARSLYNEAEIAVWEYRDSIVITMLKSGVGNSFVFGSDGSVDALGYDSAHDTCVSLRRSGDALRWVEVNSLTDRIARDGYLSIATGYRFFLSAEGSAEIINGKISLGERESQQIVERDIMDAAFRATPECPTIAELFRANLTKRIAEGTEPVLDINGTAYRMTQVGQCYEIYQTQDGRLSLFRLKNRDGVIVTEHLCGESAQIQMTESDDAVYARLFIASSSDAEIYAVDLTTGEAAVPYVASYLIDGYAVIEEGGISALRDIVSAEKFNLVLSFPDLPHGELTFSLSADKNTLTVSRPLLILDTDGITRVNDDIYFSQDQIKVDLTEKKAEYVEPTQAVNAVLAVNGVVKYQDGTLFCDASVAENETDFAALITVLTTVHERSIPFPTLTELKAGDLTYRLNDDWSIIAVTAYGNTVYVNEKLSPGTVVRTADFMLVGFPQENRGYHWFRFGESTAEAVFYTGRDSSQFTLFFTVKDGTLYYTGTYLRFLQQEPLAGVSSLDEIVSEHGTVSVTDNTLIFTPESYTTVEDFINENQIDVAAALAGIN